VCVGLLVRATGFEPPRGTVLVVKGSRHGRDLNYG